MTAMRPVAPSLAVVAVSLIALAATPLPGQTQLIPVDLTLKPTLEVVQPTDLTIAQPVAAAIAVAPMPAMVPARQVETTVGIDAVLVGLKRRLREIDERSSEIAWTLSGQQRDRAIALLQLMLAGVVPDKLEDTAEIEDLIAESIRLYHERVDVNRRILRIIDPGQKLYPGPETNHASRNATASTSVDVSKTTERGVVVCTWEEQPERKWLLVPKQAGFTRDNRPIFNYVWEVHDFPRRVQVCR